MLGLEAARCVWPIGSSDGRSCTRNPRRMTLMTQERTNSRSRGWESRCAFLGRRLNWNACHVLGNQNLEEDDTASTKTNRQSSRSKQSNKWKSNKLVQDLGIAYADANMLNCVGPYMKTRGPIVGICPRRQRSVPRWLFGMIPTAKVQEMSTCEIRHANYS